MKKLEGRIARLEQVAVPGEKPHLRLVLKFGSEEERAEAMAAYDAEGAGDTLELVFRVEGKVDHEPEN